MTAFSPNVLMGLQVLGVAFFVSLAVTGFARLGGLGDVPDHRSSHSRVTPTGGGLGIIAGVGAAILLVATLYQNHIFVRPGSGEKLASLLSLTFALSFLGLVDDRYGLSSTLKLGLMLLISALAVNAIGPVTMLPLKDGNLHLMWGLGLIGTTLWLFTVINVVNFMDGINGLFGTSLAIASAALCALAVKAGAPVTALIAGALAAALVGFLPYNLRMRATVFSGDCGALGAAFLYAGAVVFLIYEQPQMRLLYAGPLLILPLLTDVFITLIRKPFKGVGLLAPHNTHLYQRWARRRGGHVGVTLIYGFAIATMGLFVHNAYDRGVLGSLSVLAILSGLFVCLYGLRSSTLPD